MIIKIKNIMKKQFVNNLKLGVCVISFIMLSTTLFGQVNIPDITGVQEVSLN